MKYPGFHCTIHTKGKPNYFFGQNEPNEITNPENTLSAFDKRSLKTVKENDTSLVYATYQNCSGVQNWYQYTSYTKDRYKK